MKNNILIGAAGLIGSFYANSAMAAVAIHEASTSPNAQKLTEQVLGHKPSEDPETFFGGIKQMKADETFKELRAETVEDLVRQAEGLGYDVQVIQIA